MSGKNVESGASDQPGVATGRGTQEPDGLGDDAGPVSHEPKTHEQTSDLAAQEMGASDEQAEPVGQEPTAPPEGPWSRVHRTLFGSVARAAVTGIIATAIIGVIIAVAWPSSTQVVDVPNRTTGRDGPGNETQSGPPAAPASIDNAHDLRAYVLSRPFWKTAPTVFDASLALAVNPPSDSQGDLLLPSDGGVVDAYSTSDLINQGATMAGELFLAVGQIRDAIASPVSFNTGNEMEQPTDAELTAPHRRSVVYALIDGTTVSDGDVDYFPAVVAAVGISDSGRPAVYLIGLDAPLATSTYGPETGESVPQVAREFGKDALPTAGGNAAGFCFLVC